MELERERPQKQQSQSQEEIVDSFWVPIETERKLTRSFSQSTDSSYGEPSTSAHGRVVDKPTTTKTAPPRLYKVCP